MNNEIDPNSNHQQSCQSISQATTQAECSLNQRHNWPYFAHQNFSNVGFSSISVGFKSKLWCVHSKFFFFQLEVTNRWPKILLQDSWFHPSLQVVQALKVLSRPDITTPPRFDCWSDFLLLNFKWSTQLPKSFTFVSSIHKIFSQTGQKSFRCFWGMSEMSLYVRIGQMCLGFVCDLMEESALCCWGNFWRSATSSTFFVFVGNGFHHGSLDWHWQSLCLLLRL